MEDYRLLRETCQKHSEISERLLDKFLLPYAARQEKLFREMDQKLAPYKHIIRKMPPDWSDLIRTQYIANRTLRKNGLIHKYLRHSIMKELDADDRSYLEQLAATPWRFCFSVITAEPAADFYEMKDVFTGESFLLYSPSITRLLKEHPVIMWLNFIGFNGSCWQAFGPISPYHGFEPDDIFFFATELHHYVESDEDILDDIAQNPIPYMMLMEGAYYPLLFHGKDRMIHCSAEFDCHSFNSVELTRDFYIDFSGNICRLRLRRWSGNPHFAVAYYNQKQNSLALSAMTIKGFDKLVERLSNYGYHFEEVTDIQVNPSMLAATSDILKSKVELNSYERLFKDEDKNKTPEADQEQIDELNDLMQLMLPDINAGKEPDYEALAQETGFDQDTIRKLAGKVAGMGNKQKNKK